MKKLILLLALLLIFLVGTLFVLDAQLNTSDSEFPYTHSSTKALCTSENYCMDYEIFCKNEKVIEMRFTGAAIQLSQNWDDPRTSEQKEFC